MRVSAYGFPCRFQSTLSMRRATLLHSRLGLCSLISIHALHEESDHVPFRRRRYPAISIHALHEESDLSNQQTMQLADIFQSTLSMRRATQQLPIKCASLPFQSTLSMRRATNQSAQMGTDLTLFQSTLSMRRATPSSPDAAKPPAISIHALHEESDSAAGHFCPLFETQASCLALSISNNTADTTNNMSKTSNWLSVSF